MKTSRWILAAALSAVACHLAVHHATPIDRALPLLAVLTTVLAALSYPSVMLGVPLLIVAEIAIPDEGMRLLAFGAILAVCMGAAAIGLSSRASSEGPGRGTRVGGASSPESLPIPPRGPHPGPSLDARDDKVAAGVPVVAIFLLRWIPLDQVLFGRELFLLAIGVLLFLVLDRTPFALAIAVLTVLFTPAVPLRTLALPILVLLVASVARTFGMPRIVLAWPSTVAVAFAILFFAWSGVVARAFPYFLRKATLPKERFTVNQALAPRASLSLDVPEGMQSLIISGANVAHLRRGAVLGRIEPGAHLLRVGDAADWGGLRREHFYESRNPLPRDPAGRIRGYGYAAWLDGAGRVALPRGARQIRVIADAALPANAALQVEGFE